MKIKVINIIKNIFFIIISVFVVLWFMYPFYININRWLYDIRPIELIYPLNRASINILIIYFILYFIFFIVLVYKLIKYYYKINKKENYYIKKIDIVMEKPWLFLEKHIWYKLYYLNTFFTHVTEFFYSEYFKSSNIYYYYIFCIYYIYIGFIINVIILYYEVLIIKQVYYIYYCLSLFLINRILIMIINRCITCQKEWYDFALDYFQFEKEYVKTITSLSKTNLWFLQPVFLSIYFKLDDSSGLLMQEIGINRVFIKGDPFNGIYHEYIDTFHYKYYSLKKETMDQVHKNTLRIELERYCKEYGIDPDQIRPMEYNEFDLSIKRGFARGLNTYDLNIDVFLSYLQRINKHMLIMSILRISSILILMTIVLCIN